MSLMDVMSQAGLASFAQIALAIFFLVFMAIVVRTMLRSRGEMEALARLPIEDTDDVEATRARRRISP